MARLAMVCTDLIQGSWQQLEFSAFREGVEIHRLHNPAVNAKPVADTDQPSIALLKYQPGASVPLHEHRGVETILVLAGSQSDEQGRYSTGTLVINPVGSRHSVWSEDGCVVLIQWDKPVVFV